MKHVLLKRKIKRLLWRLFPLIIALILGLCFYIISSSLTGDFKSLLMSISASLIAIPIMFFGYHVFDEESKARIEVDLFEYFKSDVDTSCFTLFKHLITTFSDTENSISSTKMLLKLTKPSQVKTILSKKSFLGFYLFKTFSEEEKKLDSIIKSSATVIAFTPAQRVAITNIGKIITSYRIFIQREISNIAPESREMNLEIIKGDELSKENNKYSNRYLLMKKISKSQSKVLSFGDFPKYMEVNLLNYYNVDEIYFDEFSNLIASLSTELLGWIKSTGNEFILRNDMFREKNT